MLLPAQVVYPAYSNQICNNQNHLVKNMKQAIHINLHENILKEP